MKPLIILLSYCVIFTLLFSCKKAPLQLTPKQDFINHITGVWSADSIGHKAYRPYPYSWDYNIFYADSLRLGTSTLTPDGKSRVWHYVNDFKVALDSSGPNRNHDTIIISHLDASVLEWYYKDQPQGIQYDTKVK